MGPKIGAWATVEKGYYGQQEENGATLYQPIRRQMLDIYCFIEFFLKTNE